MRKSATPFHHFLFSSFCMFTDLTMVAMATSTQGSILTRLQLSCFFVFSLFGTNGVLSFQARSVVRRFPSHRSAATSNNGITAVDQGSEVESPNGESYHRISLKFPPYIELMDLAPGEFITSEPFFCNSSQFRVKLYPRGGGHKSGYTADKRNPLFPDKEKSGFGMSYKVQLPSFGSNPDDEKVGMYLQYLPENDDDTVDATFALRLKGNQARGRKFDVEWRAGMRFTSLEKSNLAQGMANDFGAHLMQTKVLPEFLGVSNDDSLDEPVQAEVEVTLYNTKEDDNTPAPKKDSIAISKNEDEEKKATSLFGAFGEDIRTPSSGNISRDQQHDPEQVRVGKVVVPVLNRLGQRPRMFELGAYPGVEYRILRIVDPETGKERFTSVPGASYDLKPIYPLVAQLERPWPVTIDEKEIPKLFTPNMYNAISAVGSLGLAVTGLLTAFVISQAVSLFYIPSRSMDPTLKVGDVLLVDKVTPRILGQKSQHEGDVVLFSPPSKLREIVSANGGSLTSRDLFVKRVAATPGDRVKVNAAGDVSVNGQPVNGRRDLCEAEPLRLIEKYVKETKEEQLLGPDEVFVLGDCGSVSIDSRVWGPLKANDVVGKPILRLWPMERFGAIQDLPTTANNLDISPTMEGTWQD